MGEDVNVTAAVAGAVGGEALGSATGRVLRGADTPNLGRGTCSFHGDTLVLTAEGMELISGIDAGDLVWSRDPATGQMGWKRVLAQYSNPYEETVYVTIRDVETDAEQIIISNRVHPFFVQIPGDTDQVAMGAMLLSSEGHVYHGPIPNGFWVDAADLQPGFRLLNSDQSWAEVVGVEVEDEALLAFNLTVDGFETFFVGSAPEAHPVWVHNCPAIPNLPLTDMDRAGILREASVARGNITLPGSASRAEAADLGDSWVGPGHRVASDGQTLVSADGLRTFRPPQAKPNSPYSQTGVQANFETRVQVDGKWQVESNAHLDIND